MNQLASIPADRKLAEKLFPIATGLVDGLRVGTTTPNTESIRASFNTFTILRGTRSVPMDLMTRQDSNELIHSFFYAASDFKRVDQLVERIRESRRIDPLIVVLDDTGDSPYILEGAHRLVALHRLGVGRFPAMVVIDEDKH